MAAVTINRFRSFIVGNRKKIVAFVDIAANDDFLDVGSVMHRIEGISITGDNDDDPIGATTTQGASARLTFLVTAAENNVHVELTGQ